MLATAHGLTDRGYRTEILELARAPVDQLSFRDELSRLGLTSRWASETVISFQQDQTGGDLYRLRPFGPLIPHLNIVNLAAALHRVICEFRPEIVHCWSEITNVIAGYVSTKLGVPRIVLGQRNVAPHRRDLPQSDLYRAAYHRLLQDPKVVAINNSLLNRDQYERWLDVPGGTIKLLYNGFLPGSVRIRRRRKDEAAEARRSLGLPEDARIVGTVMRFAPEKDPDLWLRTARVIVEARQNTYFVLAGYGELAHDIARKILASELANRVKVVGPTTDVGLIYAAIDVFLLTSRFEGTPNTLIEAQAAGVPVVAPLVGGTGECVLHGMTGLLVDNRKAGSLAHAVVQILDDSSWPERSAQHGPAFVNDRFGHGRMIDETVAHYRHAGPTNGAQVGHAARLT